jgi:hypothetical protein
MNVSKLWLLQCDAIKNIQQVTLGWALNRIRLYTYIKRNRWT